jgi:hypothetical protein
MAYKRKRKEDLSWCERGKICEPKNPEYHRGMLARVARRNVAKNEIDYWSGGQYFRETLENFCRLYKPASRKF